MSSAAHQFDVVDISDLRFPGGTSHSIAEEIAAQAGAGYRTGLIQLNGPLVGRVRAVNPLIRRHVTHGNAMLLVDRAPVQARIAVVRHPAVLQHAADQLPPVVADHVVVVANAGPTDINGQEHYDPAAVHRIARQRFGREPVWAPIGPLVRAEIVGRVPGDALLPEDWVNIIDVDSWRVDRPTWQSDRPVVGRHSRPSAQKWPADADTLTQVYPVDGSWQVRVLGGAGPVKSLLGRVPRSWEVLPFGAVSPREFLGGLDFFVYYHDPRWIEAFGRTILEAVASGLPAVLPPHFRELFGEAAVYAEPAQVHSVVEELRADRPRYERHVAAASEAVRERFGHENHVARLTRLIGPPASEERPADAHDELPPRLVVTGVHPGGQEAPHRPRVLLMSSNGVGMGHLTRLLSYAKHLPADVEPYFLSMSQAAPVVGRLGYPFEYLPSAKAIGMPPARWRKLFVARVVETLDRVRPDVVVFDGTWPYNGTDEIRSVHPQIRWVWSRRGMWRRGRNVEQLRKEAWFDTVLEPGDLARPYDQGATATAGAQRVGPVTLLERGDMDAREAARAALELPAEGPMALVSLGAGNINDTASDTGAAVAALRELGVGICVTQPEIAVAKAQRRDVHVVRDFPLSRRYAAFDLVISASGYNSFHELMRLGVPSLFIPNQGTALDDQEARARYAADQGWAHELRRNTADAALPLLEDLLARGPDMVAGVQDADPGNGARAAAAQIAALATSKGCHGGR